MHDTQSCHKREIRNADYDRNIKIDVISVRLTRTRRHDRINRHNRYDPSLDGHDLPRWPSWVGRVREARQVVSSGSAGIHFGRRHASASDDEDATPELARIGRQPRRGSNSPGDDTSPLDLAIQPRFAHPVNRQTACAASF
ncbi:MAG: hypothetical protein KDA71_06160 [Planctomycetales bacterium]|nr:hypothetical protein [Planctomycetales bacterium]